MGCDIHLHVEISDGRTWRHHDWRAPHEGERDEYGDKSVNYDTLFADPLYVSRNYEVFAILAGVRNYGHSFIPIAPPRGLPVDATEETKTDCLRWGVDGHSHSHLTVAELLAYDWGAPHGRFTTKTLPALQELGKPEDVRIVFWFDN